MQLHEQIENLLNQSQDLDYGDSKIDILKEAVRLADLSQNEPLSFKSRVFLMEAAVFSGYPELALIHFPWLEHCYNQNPQQYDPGLFNWMYSWIVILMAYSPNIPRDDIHKVLVRMERSYRKDGKSERILLEMYRTVATILGEYDLAKEYHDDFVLTQHLGEFGVFMGLVNHRGIEIHNESFYYGRLNENQKALEIAMPVLDGTIDYPMAFPYTLASALILFVKLGIPEQAEPHYQKALKIIRNKRRYKNLHSDLLIHTAMKGDFTVGVSMVEAMTPWLENSPIGMEQFEHSTACRLLFECMMTEAITEVRLNLPTSHPLYRADQTYFTKDLENFWAKKSMEWGRRFDERNDNTAISDYLKQTFEYGKFAFRLN